MHPNKKVLAYEYVDVTSTVRPNANHWKPEDFPTSFPGRMGVIRHTLIGIVGLPYLHHQPVAYPFAIDQSLLDDFPVLSIVKQNSLVCVRKAARSCCVWRFYVNPSHPRHYFTPNSLGRPPPPKGITGIRHLIAVMQPVVVLVLPLVRQ